MLVHDFLKFVQSLFTDSTFGHVSSVRTKSVQARLVGESLVVAGHDAPLQAWQMFYLSAALTPSKLATEMIPTARTVNSLRVGENIGAEARYK